MKVFIDTVIYKRLFEGNSPSEEYFNKLENLVKNKKFSLIFPKITRNEVHRALRKLLKVKEKEQKFTFPPKHYFDSKARENFSKIEEEYEKEWKSEYEKMIKRNLNIKKKMAKKLFNSFHKLTLDYPETKELWRLARERKIKRYPPGKTSDPLGDELAWEIILKHCVDDDLIIVSGDSDWQDLTDPKSSKINPLLLEEWKNKKTGKKLELLKDLGDLIAKFTKDYKKPEKEVEKEKTSKETLSWEPITYVSPSPPSWDIPSTTSTSTSTVSGSYVGLPSITTSWPSVICEQCGITINTSGRYVVNNGLTLCMNCGGMPWGV